MARAFERSTQTASYTFTSLGQKTVSLRKTHPLFPQAIGTTTFTVNPSSVVSAICAKGTQEYACGALSFYTCSQISTTASSAETIFRVTNAGTAEGIVTYQWKRRPLGASTWTNITLGGNTIEYKQGKLFDETASFEVMCELTTNTGRKGYSNIMIVTISSCQ
jgi:hypothetical protein